MWVLPLVGYLGSIIGFAFLTLAIASGLYYLSELVEEHTVLTKKLLTRLIQIIVGIHGLLLLVDGFPFLLTLFSAASHGIYMLNLRRFPVVKLTDEVFILSCFLVIANHFLWFRHFSAPQDALRQHIMKTEQKWTDRGNMNPGGDPFATHQLPTFREISAFFGLCVWLIPFALFVSLSAGENVLPSTSELSDHSMGVGVGVPGVGVGVDGLARSKSKRGGPGMAKMVVDRVKDWVGNVGETLGWTDTVSRRRFD